MQNPNPVNLTFHDVKKFDMQNPIIRKIATQVKASKLTEVWLTKKILMQDQIAVIENRLEKLKQLTKIDFDSDDNGGTGGGRGGGSDDGSLPSTPGRQLRYYKPCPLRPAPPPEKDSNDELMDRYNKLRSSKYYPPRPPRPLPHPLSYSKATGRASDIPGHLTPPPIPIRDYYFPPPPVDLADDSLVLPDVLNDEPSKSLTPPKPVITKPKIAPKSVLDSFSRPLTTISDSKKKYK